MHYTSWSRGSRRGAGTAQLSRNQNPGIVPSLAVPSRRAFTAIGPGTNYNESLRGITLALKRKLSLLERFYGAFAFAVFVRARGLGMVIRLLLVLCGLWIVDDDCLVFLLCVF